MISTQILQPIVALVIWTMLIWAYMYVTRIPAMKKARIDINNLKGGKGTDLDNILPPKTQWIAHNYNHLLTEPMLFYVICFVLALLGNQHELNLIIAWIYVALRIVHSLIQISVNRVKYRFIVFALSSLCIIALTLHAAIAVFH